MVSRVCWEANSLKAMNVQLEGAQLEGAQLEGAQLEGVQLDPEEGSHHIDDLVELVDIQVDQRKLQPTAPSSATDTQSKLQPAAPSSATETRSKSHSPTGRRNGRDNRNGSRKTRRASGNGKSNNPRPCTCKWWLSLLAVIVSVSTGAASLAAGSPFSANPTAGEAQTERKKNLFLL